jgi:aminopeptidase-like protein
METAPGGDSATLNATYTSLSADDDGESLQRLVADLYACCQRVAGDGIRATLAALRTYIPLTVHEVRSGTQILDWTVPPEWKLREAHITHHSGKRVVDALNSNLHVAPYSAPVRARMPLAELRRHMFSDRERFDWIPYGSSHPSDAWGFYLSNRELEALPEGEYDVCIDSCLEPGQLTYGECLVRGRSFEEVLISCHLGNPCIPNDNLSSVAVATALAQRLHSKRTRYSYRLLFIPSTIGSIAWIALNQSRLFRIKHGLVLTQLGGFGQPSYKVSRHGDAEIDRIFAFVLGETGDAFQIESFSPCGQDERQYGSPGLDLPVGRFMRARAALTPQDHASNGDLTTVHAEPLHDSFVKLRSVIDILEHNRCYLNQKPYCEPQLSKYGLARFRSGRSAAAHRHALLWVLNYSDGENTLLDIAARAGLRWSDIKHAASALRACDLLKLAGRQTSRRPQRNPRRLASSAP